MTRGHFITGGMIVMADKNIQIYQRNANNTDWDKHYPITKVEKVIIKDDESLDSYLTSLEMISGKCYSGMRILVTGDSITDAQQTASKKWPDWMAEWMDVIILNDGKSGTGLIIDNNGVDGIYDRIDTWDSTYGKFDAIIIMGNMNDGRLGPTFKVGQFGDTDEATSQYAAVDKTLQKLITKWPNLPILWIVSTPRRATATYPAPHNGAAWGLDGWFEPYAKAIKDVCANYSIPVLDLYHESGLRPWNNANNLTFFYNADGVHPNNKGHRLIARKIYDFCLRNLDFPVDEPVYDYIYDNFSRADNANSLGYADTGQQWVNPNQDVKMGIKDGTAYKSAEGSGGFYIESGISDVAVSTKIATIGGVIGIALRYENNDNTLRLYVNPADGNKLTLGKRIGEASSVIGVGNSVSAGDIISVEAVGSSVKCYRNKVLEITATVNDNIAITRHGLYVGSGADVTSAVDDFSIVETSAQ